MQGGEPAPRSGAGYATLGGLRDPVFGEMGGRLQGSPARSMISSPAPGPALGEAISPPSPHKAQSCTWPSAVNGAHTQ